jgi:hypothetical protein
MTLGSPLVVARASVEMPPSLRWPALLIRIGRLFSGFRRLPKEIFGRSIERRHGLRVKRRAAQWRRYETGYGGGTRRSSILAASRFFFGFVQPLPKRIYFRGGGINAALQIGAPPVEKFQFLLATRSAPVNSPFPRVERHGAVSSSRTCAVTCVLYQESRRLIRSPRRREEHLCKVTIA